MRRRSSSDASRPERGGRAAIGAASALLGAAFVAPALVGGKVPVWRDFLTVFLPYRLYGARALAAGEIPLWAPEPGFGMAFFAAWQPGVLEPLSLPIVLSPGPVGIGVFLALHFTLAAAGMAAFLERHGLGAAPRLLGGVTYALGGTTVSLAAWGHFTVAAVLPLVLLAAEILGERFSRTAFAALALLVATAALAGAPESLAQAVVVSAGACLWAAPAGGRTAATSRFAAAVLLGLGLAAVQLVPAIEAFSLSERAGGLGRVAALRHSLEPVTLTTLLRPHRLDGGLVAPVPESEFPLVWSVYVGLAPLVLAGAGVFTRAGRPWVLLLGAVTVLALGHHTPVLPVLYDLAPGPGGLFRYPQKLLLTMHLAVSVLAALGLGRVLGVVPPRRRLVIGMAFAVLATVDLWLVHRPALVFADWESLRASAPPPELRERSLHPRVFHYERRRAGLERWDPKFAIGGDYRVYARRAWSDLAGNAGLLYGIGFAGEAGGLRTRELAELARFLETTEIRRGVRVLGALGVGSLIGEDRLEAAGATRARKGDEGRAWVYRIPAAPRVYLAGRVTRAADVREALRLLSVPDFRAGFDAVVVGDGRDLPPVPEKVSTGAVRIEVDSPHTVELRVLAPRDALLVLADAFDPGWRATVDGRETAVHRVNGLLRGVVVPKGSHTVRFRYEPVSVWLGVWVSILALAVLIVVVARARRGSSSARVPSRAAEPRIGKDG